MEYNSKLYFQAEIIFYYINNLLMDLNIPEARYSFLFNGYISDFKCYSFKSILP